MPLAVSMLLFDSDLQRVFRDTGTLLIAFVVGAIATILGTLVAYPILPAKSLGPDVGRRVACALAARHIGGAINFVAVAETLNIEASAVSAASTYRAGNWDCRLLSRHLSPLRLIRRIKSLTLFSVLSLVIHG